MTDGFTPLLTPSPEELWTLRFMQSWHELSGENAVGRAPVADLAGADLSTCPAGLARRLFFAAQRRHGIRPN